MQDQGREVIDAIRDGTDIAELVSSYLPLKKAGAHLKALCPFHDEKTPSFTVNPERQIFKCFGCGEGGDVFSFVMKMERIEFPEAMSILAERAGVRLEDTPREAQGPSKSDLRRVAHWAFEFYRALYLTPEGRACRDYVASRGISEAAAESFGLGRSPDGGDQLVQAARRKQIGEELLLEAGLAARRSDGRLHDRFWGGRLLFPIRDVLGRVVAFGGRSLDGSEPKYLNSPEGPLFHKGKLLFGLDRLKAWREHPILIVEGYTDVVMAEEVGSGGLVATLGTALTPDHARLLRRHAKDLILVYDGDAAGMKAARRGARILLQAGHLDIKVAVLPHGEDPCDFFRRRGAEGRREIEEDSAELIDFLIEQSVEENGGDGVAGRHRVAAEFSELLSGLADAVSRELVTARVASRLGVSPHSISETVGQGRRLRQPAPVVVEESVLTPRARGLVQAQKDALAAVLNQPSLLPRVGEAELKLFPSGQSRQLLELLLAQGRGMESAALLATIADPELRTLATSVLQLEVEEGLDAALEDALSRLRRHRWEEESRAKIEAFAAQGAADDSDLKDLQDYLRRMKGPRRGTSAGGIPGSISQEQSE